MARYAPFPDRTAGLPNVTELAFCSRTDSAAVGPAVGVVSPAPVVRNAPRTRCGIAAGWPAVIARRGPQHSQISAHRPAGRTL